MSLRNLIKITKVRKASDYDEPCWRFKAEILSPAISFRLWFDSRLRHNAFRKPGLRSFRLPYHFIVASQWDVNQRSQCMQSAVLRMLSDQWWKLYNVVTRDVQRGDERGDGPGHPRQLVIQRTQLQKVHSQNLVTRPEVQNFLWMWVARSNV